MRTLNFRALARYCRQYVVPHRRALVLTHGISAGNKMKVQTLRSKSLTVGLLLLASIPIRAQVNVTTWHNDLARTGANTQETTLTTANVNVNNFGKLFSVSVDGQVYAQPLYLSGVSIGGGTHNVLYVETEHDSVYAIDADSGTIYAHVSLIPPGGTTVSSSSDLNCGDINPEVGITGTPVIDPASNILYVVSKAKVGGNIVQQLHALSTASLAEELNGPVEIQAEVAGTAPDGNGSTVTFNPVLENQRPGLALENGHVLIAWGAHCDNPPYHGWLISYNASTLSQEAVWNTTPDGEPNGSTQSPQGGIWMAGAAPAVDGNGDIYVTSGNGYWNGSRDLSDSVMKLGPPANNTFPLLDYFTPFDQGGPGDSDVGSAGLILFPTTSSGAQMLVQQGKQGTIYLVNRNNLGKDCAKQSSPCTTTDTQLPEELRGATPGVLSSPLYWNGHVYWPSYSNLFSWSVDPASGLISSSPTSQSTQTFARTAGASLSANGTTNGIVWIMQNTGELFAFDATNLSNVLWTSGQAPNGRDRADSSVKFEPPTIVNGKVYYGTADEVVAYGLLGGTTPSAATPAFSPAGGTYTGPQSVTISDSTPSATVYYTTNGTTPTTASTLYAGAITVNSSETLEAIAVASGLTNSAVGSATYTIQQSGGTTATPTFSPAAGTYTATQLVTISDTTNGATIYYTTNGTTPTAASTPYTGPISVSASETLEAIAVASGQSASAVATGTYTINTTGGGSGTSPVSYPNGFPSAIGFTLDGGATVTGGALQLTDGGNFEARAIWYSTPLNVQQFTTDFTFQITPAAANSSDGMTFTIQNQGLTAHGGIGGALGYQGVKPSVAVKFDTFNNSGEGVNSTGFYTNGAAPTVPAIDLTPSGVNLHSGHVMHAHLTYDGTTLALTLTDTVTNATFTASRAINIPGTVGANTALVGFTAGTGGTVSTQEILNWTYQVN
jgi:Legume lectin domain/Chitobiase/beta-hexosaminidase C-terminal domain